MTDEQLRVRLINKRIITLAIVFVLLACGGFYYLFHTQPDVDSYNQQVAREGGLQAQIQGLEDTNANLRATIDQTGKELISFSENKIMYINLASELSVDCDVKINKLSVSDVWNEGEMSGMTTSIEIEGTLPDVTKFVNSYCGINYTNRINIVSCRPAGRYPWLIRNIDGQRVLGWFDISAEQTLHEQFLIDEQDMLNRMSIAAGVSPADLNNENVNVVIDPSITVDKMFEEKTFKVFLEIDFLGRN